MLFLYNWMVLVLAMAGAGAIVVADADVAADYKTWLKTTIATSAKLKKLSGVQFPWPHEFAIIPCHHILSRPLLGQKLAILLPNRSLQNI